LGFKTSTDGQTGSGFQDLDRQTNWINENSEKIARCFTGLSLPPPPKTSVTDTETYWINIYDAYKTYIYGVFGLVLKSSNLDMFRNLIPCIWTSDNDLLLIVNGKLTWCQDLLAFGNFK
jgi:hypothetical protein